MELAHGLASSVERRLTARRMIVVMDCMFIMRMVTQNGIPPTI